MIVSDDYVLGIPTSAYGWPHVVSFKQNPDMVPGHTALTLCGRTSRTYNFSGVFQWWHLRETVCAECRKAAVGVSRREGPRP